MITYVYKCYKCNKGPKVEQKADEPELDLKCRKCGRKLFRCNLVPGICTDSTFMSGSHVDDGFGTDDRARRIARARARAAGVSPDGKRYMPGLARSQYDPRAWVDGKGDVKRICEKEGWGCSGSVNVKERANDSPNPLDEPYTGVDPALVEKDIRTKEIAAGERLPSKERAELKEKLTTAYAGEGN